jgi:hypothetical protein
MQLWLGPLFCVDRIVFGDAGGEAGVGVVVVGVVAVLAGVHGAVAAGDEAALGGAIGVAVAGLAGSDVAVAADVELAAGDTGVLIDVVGVVAGFTGLDEAVAAGG